MTQEEARTETISKMAMVCLELGIGVSGEQARELAGGMLDRATTDVPLLMQAIGADDEIARLRDIIERVTVILHRGQEVTP